ncbi:hypothetical protein BY996DRAFT_7158312 [Phakopsora pachyrhizi]|uniref:Expressed protein n=1 Tax=Phakopsora pachyrhizi TaxID=170000 RepID=A0AAV0BEK3_PHAPC|nr:hypothetical protein BY996DRAFT_7158312 [Phakopsora pachyrhizi]CAH7684633.1 expressed protein [Phakopsora pachyrhizi]
MRLACIFIFHHFVSLPVRARFEAFDYPSAEYRIAEVGENSSALNSYQPENYNHSPTPGNNYEKFYDYNGQQQTGQHQHWPEINVNDPYFRPVSPYVDNGHLNQQTHTELENDSNINFDQTDWSQIIDFNDYSDLLNPEENEFYTSTDFTRFESAPPARSDEQDFVSNLGSGNLDSIFDGLPEVSGVFDDPMFYSDQNPHRHYELRGHTSTVDDAQMDIGPNIHPTFNEAQNMIDQSFGLTSYSPYDFPHHQGSDCSSSFEWAQNSMNPTNIPMDNSITNSEAIDFGQNVQPLFNPPYTDFTITPAIGGINQKSAPFSREPTVTPYQEVSPLLRETLFQKINNPPVASTGRKRNKFGSIMTFKSLLKQCDIIHQKEKFQNYEETFFKKGYIQKTNDNVDTISRRDHKLIHDFIYTLYDQTLTQFYSQIALFANEIKIPAFIDRSKQRYRIRDWEIEFRNYIYETSMLMINQLKICVKHLKFLQIDVDGKGKTEEFNNVDNDDVAQFLKLFWKSYVEFSEKGIEALITRKDRDTPNLINKYMKGYKIENVFKKIQFKISKPSTIDSRGFISNHVLFAYFRKKLAFSSWIKISSSAEKAPWNKDLFPLIDEAILVEFVEYFSTISKLQNI